MPETTTGTPLSTLDSHSTPTPDLSSPTPDLSYNGKPHVIHVKNPKVTFCNAVLDPVGTLVHVAFNEVYERPPIPLIPKSINLDQSESV